MTQLICYVEDETVWACDTGFERYDADGWGRAADAVLCSIEMHIWYVGASATD